jgi:hypothetical protein
VSYVVLYGGEVGTIEEIMGYAFASLLCDALPGIRIFLVLMYITMTMINMIATTMATHQIHM